MTPDRPAPLPTAEHLNDDVARRVLARAVELDAHGGAFTSVAQLREAAREAGISPGAFETALREWQATQVPAPAAALPSAQLRAGRRRTRRRVVTAVGALLALLVGASALVGRAPREVPVVEVDVAPAPERIEVPPTPERIEVPLRR